MLNYLAAAAVIFLVAAGWAWLMNRSGDHQRPFLCNGRRNGFCCSGLAPEECLHARRLPQESRKP